MAYIGPAQNALVSHPDALTQPTSSAIALARLPPPRLYLIADCFFGATDNKVDIGRLNVKLLKHRSQRMRRADFAGEIFQQDFGGKAGVLFMRRLERADQPAAVTQRERALVAERLNLAERSQARRATDQMCRAACS